LKTVLNSRSRGIAEILLRTNGYLTISNIAQLTGCSPRMVRYQIDNIRGWLGNNGVDLHYQKRKGLFVRADRKVRHELLYAMSSHKSIENKLSPTERQQVLTEVFLNTDHFQPLESLMDILGVSRSTVLRDIDEFNQTLKKYGLQLVATRGKGYALRGNEMHLRQMLADVILDSQSEHEFLYHLHNKGFNFNCSGERMTERLLSTLEKWDGPGRFDFLMRVTKSLESKLGTNFSDTGRTALVIHLAVAVHRLETGKPIKMGAEQISYLSSMREFSIAKEAAGVLARRFRIEIPEDEIGYIALRLLGAKRALSGLGLSNVDEANSLVTGLSHEIGREAELILGQKIVDNELIDGLVTHLIPAYYRVKYGLPTRNPLLAEMKAQYRTVFLAASKACEVFTRRTGMSLPEEEVAYVAMHIGAALERATRKNPRNKRIAIVCASGIGTASILSAQIESRFPMAEIVGTYSVSEVMNGFNQEVDAVISTVPLTLRGIPCAIVNPVLRFRDICTIDSLLNLIPSVPVEKRDPEDSSLRLYRENIRFNVRCTDWTDAVRTAGLVLVDGGFCERRYVDAMIRHIETYGSYVVLQGGLAIPHATPQDGVIRPGISLIRLISPVKFPGTEENVWTVMGLALTERVGSREMDSLKQYLFKGEPERTARARTMADLLNSLSSIIQ
jgi:transcriptional antiterminator/mannitol/fructose-specific phosphotransferase system IIA component (Ntr-type)